MSKVIVCNDERRVVLEKAREERDIMSWESRGVEREEKDMGILGNSCVNYVSKCYVASIRELAWKKIVTV